MRCSHCGGTAEPTANFQCNCWSCGASQDERGEGTHYWYDGEVHGVVNGVCWVVAIPANYEIRGPAEVDINADGL